MRDLAIRNTHPTVITIRGEIDAWDKDGNVVELDESKITTELARLEKEFSDNQYQRSRSSEFPSIPDQLDEIYHNGVDSWKAVIKVTKDNYPKG